MSLRMLMLATAFMAVSGSSLSLNDCTSSGASCQASQDGTSFIQSHMEVTRHAQDPEEEAKDKADENIEKKQVDQTKDLIKELPGASGLHKEEVSDQAKEATDKAKKDADEANTQEAQGGTKVQPPGPATAESRKVTPAEYDAAKKVQFGVDENLGEQKTDTGGTGPTSTTPPALLLMEDRQHQHTEDKSQEKQMQKGKVESEELRTFMLRSVRESMAEVQQMEKKYESSEKTTKRLENLESWLVENRNDPFLLELSAAHQKGAASTAQDITDSEGGINGGWGDEWKQVTPGAALGGAFGGAGTIVAKVAAGEKINWKEVGGVVLDIVGSLNPMLGFVTSIIKGIMGTGSEDEVANKIGKAVSAESARQLANVMTGIREELGWVPDMLKEGVVSRGVQLSYFLMVQHTLAAKVANVFHNECISQKPWKVPYQEKAASFLESVPPRSGRGKVKASSLKTTTNTLSQVGGAKTEGCKKWVKDQTRVDLMISYANLHLQVLTSITLANEKLKPLINERILYVSWRYQALLNLALKEYIPWRLTQVTRKHEAGDVTVGHRSKVNWYRWFDSYDSSLKSAPFKSSCNPCWTYKTSVQDRIADKEWNRLYPAWHGLLLAAKGMLDGGAKLSSKAQGNVAKKLEIDDFAPPPQRCSRDSDICLQKFSGQDWSGYTCASAVGKDPAYCKTYDKDLLRCCSQSCGIMSPAICDKEQCEALKGSGNCNWGPGNPCQYAANMRKTDKKEDFKTETDWCPIQDSALRGQIASRPA